MRIRRATPDDETEVLAILSEAARWLASRGIGQWPAPFPAKRVRPALERGDTYLAFADGRAVATLALEWSDPVFWGDRPPDAGYVHRVAVRREASGRRLGAELLDWAEGRTAACGRPFLRLDCMLENERLRRYYEELGFVHRGDVGGGFWRASLYERRCS